eukprot:COSAG03_NODE_950_length_5221_cov_7.488286_4_plen_122_part_00
MKEKELVSALATRGSSDSLILLKGGEMLPTRSNTRLRLPQRPSLRLDSRPLPGSLSRANCAAAAATRQAYPDMGLGTPAEPAVVLFMGLPGVNNHPGYMAQKSREARQRRRLALETEGDAN